MNREPVRILWVVVVALGAVLGVGGVADYIPDRVLFWLGVLFAVLTAVVGEMVRSRVTPLADPRDNQGRPLAPAGTGAGPAVG